MGGVLSSASSIASTATLITHHEVSISTGVTGVILSSLTSILINIPFIRTISEDKSFRRKVFFSLLGIVGIGLIGVALNAFVFQLLSHGG